MLAPLPLLLLALLGDVLVVDDDGVAPFTTIQAAVDVAAPGDTVFVEPGTYSGFLLSKRLAVLGREGSQPVRTITLVRIADAPSFKLAGLQMPKLDVTGVHGPAIIDDCTIGVSPASPAFKTLEISDCEQLLVSRCTASGKSGFIGPEPWNGVDGGVAARVDASTVVFVGCRLYGGPGGDNTSSGGNGGVGLDVRQGSLVQVAGCPEIMGGDEGVHFGLSSQSGLTGDGIFASASTVLIRGASSDFVLPGWFVFTPQPEGYSVHATSSSLAVVSGVFLSSLGYTIKKDASSTVIQPASPEPFLEFSGGVQPGTTATLNLSGPAGQPALVLMSLDTGAVSPQAVDGMLWPALPGLLVPLVATGSQPPLALSANLPADLGLESLSLWVQAVFPGLPGSLHAAKMFLTNPDALQIRN